MSMTGRIPSKKQWISWNDGTGINIGQVVGTVPSDRPFNVYDPRDSIVLNILVWWDRDWWDDIHNGKNGPFEHNIPLVDLDRMGLTYLNKCPLLFRKEDNWINWLNSKAV